MSESNAGAGGALAGEGSPCPAVVFTDRTYKIGWPTQRAKEWLELLVAWHAERELEALAPARSAAKQAAKERALERDLSAGEHRTFGALWNATVDGPNGMPLFVASLLMEHAPDKSFEAVFADGSLLWHSGAAKVRRALAQVTPPFAAALAAQAGQPPEQAAARAAALTVALLERIAAPPETPSDGPSGSGSGTPTTP